MVNRAAPKRALTDFGYARGSCEAEYCEAGSYWILEPVLTIAYYYDEAYLERNPSAQSDLTQCQNEIAAIIKAVFGVNPVVEAPGNSATQSLADECFNDKDEHCECRTATNHDTVCEQNYNTTNYHLVHHKSCTGVLLKFNDSTKTTGAHKVCVLISGHVNCGKNGNNHKYDAVAGVARSDLRVATSFVNNTSDATIREKLTSLHEISHCLGALDGTVDQAHNNNKCVMSDGRTRNNDYLLEQWEWGYQNSASYKNLFCTDCKNKISTYLLTF